MSRSNTPNRYVLAAILCCAVMVAGCGGAETRKARHLAKGQAFLVDGNFDKARVEFRNALQIAPNDSEARFKNGVVDEKLGNPREAAQFYQGAIDSNADNVHARISLGRLILFSGAPENALEVIKPSLVLHPDDPGLLTVRAAARTQLEDPDGALQDAERAVHLAPSDEDAVAVLGGIYKSLGQTDKARSLLENAIKQVPGTVDLRLALAQLYANQGQEPQVEAVLIDLVRLRPQDKAHRLRLAQYYARLNHIDEAERVLREAIKSFPNEHDLKTDLVQFLSARRGRDAAAKELAAMIAAVPKDYEMKFAQAAFYEQGKDGESAKNIYLKIIAAANLDAVGITARDRLAALLAQNNDTAGAQKLLAEVLAKSPRDNDALILRGNLALAHQDPKTAIADLRSVLRDQPNSIAVMRALARAHLANGEPALAEETMRRAVDANPKDSRARLDLAQLLMQLGKPEQAKPVIDELVKQEPNNVTSLEAQFQIAAATKDVAGAKAAADALVSTDPKLPLGYFYQGAVAETEKKLDDALRFYTVALEMQPDSAQPLQGVVRALMSLNRAPEALKRLEEIATRFPKLPFALNIKGEILLAAHRTAEANLVLLAARDRDVKWAPVYRSLAISKVMDHDASGAIVILQAGIPVVESPEPLQAELADLYEKAGQPDAAIGVYETILRKNPGADVAANNLAVLLIANRKDQPSLDRAKELSARFSASANAAYRDTYGWVLYKRGESAAAVEALQGALSKAPESPISLYHLGMAQAYAGQSGAARDNLSRSLKSGKSFSGMDEAKATLDKLATTGSVNKAAPKT